MDTIATSHGMTFVKDLARSGVDDRAFRRAAARGDLIQVHRGAYMPADEWLALDRYAQYRRRIVAVALCSRTQPVLTHESAAAIWGIPALGRRTNTVHVLTSPASGSRAENGVQRHGMDVDEEDVLEDGGVRFTSFRRTLWDLMRESPFASAVAGVDWSLRPADREPKPFITRAVLAEYTDRARSARGRRRVQRVLDFADPRSESPGESLSRAAMSELGFPPPELQVDIRDADGLAGRVDFFWENARLIGEFDGDGKYGTDPATARRAVVAEKWREDRLRATGKGLVRWDWRTAANGPLLFDRLTRAGLTATKPRPHVGPNRAIRAAALPRIARSGP
jgi:hypothetical protein